MGLRNGHTVQYRDCKRGYNPVQASRKLRRMVSLLELLGGDQKKKCKSIRGPKKVLCRESSSEDRVSYSSWFE